MITYAALFVVNSLCPNSKKEILPMKKFILLLAVTFILAPISGAKPPEAPDAGQQWWKHVEYLASDDLKGR
jgi:hypothetical protein